MSKPASRLRTRKKPNSALDFSGMPDAQIRLFSANNGIVIEYVYFKPAPPLGQGVGFGQPAVSDTSRCIVPPEDYGKIGEIITTMHVTATLKAAR